jgi:hypothetical protein
MCISQVIAPFMKTLQKFASGFHSLELIEPDVLLYRIRGTLDAPEMRAMIAQQIAWLGGLGYVLSVVDTTELDHVTASALRAVRESRSGPLPRAVALFGASFTARVAADLLFRALGMLSSRFVRFQFFDDEAQCFAWIEEMRPLVIEDAARHPINKNP